MFGLGERALSGRLLVDGRIFSLQQKGGISVLWARILSDPTLATKYDVALALYPGHERNVHLSAELPKLRQHLNIIELSIPPSDNTNFSSPEHDAARVAHCRSHFGSPDLVLNTYYGSSLGGSVRQLVVLHDMAHEEIPELRAKDSTRHVLALKRTALESAEAIVAISMTTRSAMARAYGESLLKRTTVIYHGHDRVPDHAHGKCVVYVGTRGAYKRFDVLAAAAEKVIPGSGWSLHVVGGEPQDDTIRGLRQLLGPALLFVDQPSDEEINCHIAKAGIYVSPSVYEGFGLPLLQAMASGTLPILSDIGVYREIGGTAARYFEPTDSGALANLLHAAFAEGAPVKRSFGVRREWSDVIREYIELIDRLVRQ